MSPDEGTVSISPSTRVPVFARARMFPEPKARLFATALTPFVETRGSQEIEP
jgi:hypothetical protein